MSFTHLHVHTEYSLLDGAARIKDLIAKTKEMGMDAVAITDHGVMFGVIDFYKEAKKQGIKPIIGCEVYTAARRMQDKEAEKDKRQGHLVLLAKNETGYHNLVKIVSAGFTQGFYYKPRVDHQLLRQHSEGLIALTACLAGNVQQNLLRSNYEGAKAEVMTLVDIFGKDNVYLELQDQGLPEEERIYPMMVRLHQETGLPFVATNDVHYVNQGDAKAHDILLCIQTATNVDDEDRMRFANDQFYLKSEREMQQLFGHIEGALENSAKIAQRCNVDFTFGEYHLPEFTAPDGLDNMDYFRKLCTEGLKGRYPDAVDHPQEWKPLEERLEYEIGTIVNMGYVEYFLIVWDFINYARKNGIVVGPGRGSAAGSIVAYCLHITDIDPIRYGLIFERFLNPDRISMPDIDIDFCYERRQEVINYVIEKYGEDKVAQIITFGTMKAKAAIRDVGRAMNMTYGEVDAIAKKVPFDLKMTLSKALEMNPELKKDYENDSRIQELIDTAKALEGMPRHASTHAAGVVISKKSIHEYVPLYLAEKGVSTQFTMTTIEELGLLKMDFLGLRNLTVIRDALELIQANHHKTIDFSTMVVYDDPKIFELISSGNTMGIFQLESSGMRQFVKNLRPDCFEDVVAGISLYRPGPMNSIPTYIENKKNPNHISYLHPKLEPILSVTYGCMVYQEQVMQIVRDLAGYTYGRSDLVRRAMSKKKRDAMELEREYFVNGKVDEQGNVEIQGCARNGIPAEIANEIYDQMISFAEYAFNKSHAAAYAVLAYETAYLKAYYPVEFMAALMTSVIGDAGQIAKYIRNCNEMKIEILPPDVLESEKKFTVRNGKIRFGLLGVKNVGEGVIDAIISLRQKAKPKDIFHLISDIDIHEINKKAVESLIKAGALDCFTENRAAQLAIYESLIESAQNTSRKNIEGQMSLFQSNTDLMEEAGAGGRLPEVANFSKELLMGMEKEMLGVYLTGHPLADYADQIERITTVNTEELNHAEENPDTAIHDGDSVVMAGIISSKKTLITKKNQMMAFVQLEDLYGTAEVIVFPGTYERASALIREDSIIAVKGTINFKEEEAPKVLANVICTLDDYKDSGPQYFGGSSQGSGRGGSHGGSGGARPKNRPAGSSAQIMVKLVIPDTMEENQALDRIRQILCRYPGDVPVAMMVQATGRKFKTKSDLWVMPVDSFWEEMMDLLGEENVRR